MKNKQQYSGSELKPIAWFEEAVLAQMPQQSILDAASIGVWSIAEQSGLLAGLWKRHRASMAELDPGQLSTIMGELLMAIVQMTNAIGMDLESIMDQQIERLKTTPTKKGSRVAQSQAAKNNTPQLQLSQRTQKKRLALTEVPVPTEAKSAKGAPRDDASITKPSSRKSAAAISKSIARTSIKPDMPPVQIKKKHTPQQMPLDIPAQQKISSKKRVSK